MASAPTKLKLGRPSDTGAPRNRQFSFPVSEDERSVVVDAASAAGMTLTAYIRDAVLDRASGNTHTGNVSAKSLTNPANGITHMGYSELPIQKMSASGRKKLNDYAPPLEMRRTRADAGASAHSEKEERKETELGDSSSLRSSQGVVSTPVLAQEREPEVDDAPWSNPAPLKMSFKLSTGELVVNTWLFANGCRIPGPDVIRLLESPSYKPLKKAMLQCFARSLRDSYRMRWCSAYNKRQSAWRDTPRSNSALLRAAEFLAIEYAGRGMSSNQFIDACDEMRPKSVRFVPVDMLGSAIGARVAAWIPPEQRDRSKSLTSHVDQSGTAWITPDGEAPVVVLRSAADRERFLRQHKVK